MATGFSPKPRGGWTSSRTLPAWSAASTMSPSPLADLSTYSSPGGGPPAFSLGRGTWPPGRLHRAAQFVRQPVNPLLVLRGGDADGRAGQLLVGQPFGVLAAGRDDGVDQGVTVRRLDARQRVRAADRAGVVAALAQRP